MSLDSFGIKIPYENSSNINEINKIIEENKGHRIILVGKVEDIQELKGNIPLYYIHRIFTLGDGTKLNIKKIEVTSVLTNERDLMIEIIRSTVSYTHDEQMRQIELGKTGIANKRANDVLQLLDQIQKLYFNHPE